MLFALQQRSVSSREDCTADEIQPAERKEPNEARKARKCVGMCTEGERREEEAKEKQEREIDKKEGRESESEGGAHRVRILCKRITSDYARLSANRITSLLFARQPSCRFSELELELRLAQNRHQNSGISSGFRVSFFLFFLSYTFEPKYRKSTSDITRFYIAFECSLLNECSEKISTHPSADDFFFICNARCLGSRRATD